MPNFKRLTIVLLVLMLAGGTLHGVHFLQQGRRVESLESELERTRQGEDPQQHIATLKRYLQARPSDTVRRFELLDLQARHASNSDVLFNVYHQYQSLLKADPDNAELRQRVLSLALRAEEYDDVLSHLEVLAERTELTPEMLLWKAKALQKIGDVDGAAYNTYLKIIEIDPTQFEAYVELETITRKGREAEEKSGFWIRQMTEANPRSAKAFLAQARYFIELHKLPEALAAAETALELKELPTESVLLWSDIVALQREEQPAADGPSVQDRDEQLTKRLHEAWKADPGEGKFAAKLAELALRHQRTDEAERLLRKGLDQSPDDPLLHWELADLAITQGKLDEARTLATKLTVAGVQRGLIEYLRGRIFLHDKEWYEAAKCLRRSRDELVTSPRLAAQADLYLADCYEELGEDEDRLSACRRAVQLQPLFVAARERLARALLAVGRTDEALGEYRKMLDMPDAPIHGWTPDVGWSAVAKLLILRNLSLPEGERHWEDIDPVLKSLAEAAPESVDAALLSADIWASRGQLGPARDKLMESEVLGRKDARWWVALINLSLRDGTLQRAQTELREAEKAVGENVELKLLEASLVVHGSSEGYLQLAEIGRAAKKWPTPDRVRLLYQLAELYANVGRAEDALAAYQEIARLTPKDVRIWQQLFDSALNRNDVAAAQKCQAEMRKIEGREGSSYQLAQAQLNLRGAGTGDQDAQRGEARSILTKLQVRRPRWSRVAWTLGSLDELEDHPLEAAQNYQKAFDLGERHPELMRRALSLSQELHRYDQAEEMIRRWETTPNTPISPEINRLAAEVSLVRQEPQQALLRAARAVSENSSNFEDHLWLAQVYRAAGDVEREETELRTAVRLAPYAGTAWLALTQQLLRNDRKDEAEAIIDRIRTEAPEDRQPPILALCLDALGQFPAAEREYLRALELVPEDRRLLHDAARFFQRTRKLADAERYWRKLLSLNDRGTAAERCFARRGLAMVLTMQGDYARFREAVSLVDKNLQELPRSAADLRAKASLLTRRGDPRQRQEARDLFTRLSKEEPLTISDQALLASLCELIGELPKAQETWQALVASETSNPIFLAGYISVLLKHHAESGADIWLERLHQVAPDWLTTAELQADYWLHDLQIQKIVDLFQQRIDREQETAARARRCVESAATLERLARTRLRDRVKPGDRAEQRQELLRTAEAHFRQYAELDPSKQHVLAAFLARSGRLNDALALFDEAWSTAPPAIVSSLLANSLSQASAPPETIARAVESLAARLPAPPPVSMLIDLGALEEAQQHFTQAEKYYRQALTIDPNNVVALNNLAFLLALQNRSLDEALQLITQAINQAGPLPALLDTRAQVALAKGDLESARIDREAVAWETLTPAAWFRLAIVYQQLKDQRSMREAAVRAQNGGLEPTDLHYFERRFFAPIMKAVEDSA